MKKPKTPKTIKIGSETIEVATAKGTAPKASAPKRRQASSKKKTAPKRRQAPKRAKGKASKKASAPKRRQASKKTTPQVCLAQTAVKALASVAVVQAHGLASHGHRLKAAVAGKVPFEAEIEGEIGIPKASTSKRHKASKKTAKRAKGAASKKAAPKRRKASKKAPPPAKVPPASNVGRCGAKEPTGHGVCKQPANHKGLHTVATTGGDIISWSDKKVAPKRRKASKKAAPKAS